MWLSCPFRNSGRAQLVGRTPISVNLKPKLGPFSTIECPHSTTFSPQNVLKLTLIGRTPWSARDAPVPHLCPRIKSPNTGEKPARGPVADEGVRPTARAGDRGVGHSARLPAPQRPLTRARKAIAVGDRMLISRRAPPHTRAQSNRPWLLRIHIPSSRKAK
jgi:hypothetical protein